jgi:hypothetical protein
MQTMKIFLIMSLLENAASKVDQHQWHIVVRKYVYTVFSCQPVSYSSLTYFYALNIYRNYNQTNTQILKWLKYN